jgi:hypothetical protein
VYAALSVPATRARIPASQHTTPCHAEIPHGTLTRLTTDQGAVGCDATFDRVWGSGRRAGTCDTVVEMGSENHGKRLAGGEGLALALGASTLAVRKPRCREPWAGLGCDHGRDRSRRTTAVKMRDARSTRGLMGWRRMTEGRWQESGWEAWVVRKVANRGGRRAETTELVKHKVEVLWFRHRQSPATKKAHLDISTPSLRCR